MAARGSSSQEADSDSSAEDLERCREAAWEPPGPVKKTVQHPENSAFLVVPSLRGRPNSHEHDGNELQTTPEFRSHVAKKLAAMLDSCIKEIPGNNSVNQEFTATSDSEDEGFRLLTTSVPGDSGKILPSPTLKRRVASSTSEDSEEEKQRRCREAAVSGFDILRSSALQTIPVEIIDTANNNQKKKKKKKKKRGLTDEADDQSMESQGKINVFKKKKRERRTSDETQSEEQAVPSQIEMQSKKNKSGSDRNNTVDAVVDGSKKKKKEIGLNKDAASEQNVSPLCGESGTKNKKKKAVVEHCNVFD